MQQRICTGRAGLQAGGGAAANLGRVQEAAAGMLTRWTPLKRRGDNRALARLVGDAALINHVKMVQQPLPRALWFGLLLLMTAMNDSMLPVAATSGG